MDDTSNEPQEPDSEMPEPAEPAEAAAETAGEATTQSLYGHPLAALGGALMVAGILVFIVLLGLDYIAETENPYRALVAFIGAPVIGISASFCS